MADYGIRVSKDGYDALTDADTSMAFTSKRYSDKLLATPVVSATLSGTIARVRFVHNLGYVPQFWGFDMVSGSIFIPDYLGDYIGNGIDVTFDMIADNTNIDVCWLATNGSMPSMTVSAVIFIFERST